MLKAIYTALFLFVLTDTAGAQWVAQQSGTSVRLRGVSAVSSTVAWASGDKGTYARTTDGGRTWQSGTVSGAEELDFRDVAAFDADSACLLSIGEGDKSRIYRTTDGGRSWTMQYRNPHAAGFFDCMAFWDSSRGIAVSDPVDGKFLMITTTDGGRTWKETPRAGMPPALSGEGAFAASGTCVAVQGRKNAWFGTGGPGGARIFRSVDGGQTWKVSATPMMSSKTAGIFSLTFRDARHGVAVGGDYAKEGEVGNNVAWTNDGGQTWRLAGTKRPNGYRSCVVSVPGSSHPRLIAVGPTGSDDSMSGGRSWRSLGVEGFHGASFARSLGVGWAVGENGRIAVYAGGAVESKSLRAPARRRR
ncbi:MAG: WD40/YVTN/BNR-like repeat-containing protein [Pyrinomonadaceae bacterium]